MQRPVDLAYRVLNDDDRARYTIEDVTDFANQALIAVLNKRPDLFVGQYSALPNGQLALGDPFPLDARWVQPVADITVALAQTKDEEEVIAQRVDAILKRAMSLLA